MGKGNCCRVSVILLLLATLLLIVAIATPGWSIVVKGNSEELASVFYSVRCDVDLTVKILETKCRSRSYMALFRENWDFMRQRGYTGSSLAEVEKEYHVLVLRQVLAVTSAVSSVLVSILQASRRGSLDRSHVRLIVSSIVTSSFVVGILLTLLAREMVDLANQLELLSQDDDRDHTYMGIPYSLVLVFGSAILHMIAIVTMGAQLYTPKQGRQIQKRRISDSYMDYNSEPELETDITKYAYDNPILSERL